MLVNILIIIIVSYLLGNLNGAILISRFLEHDDVRRHGSGNAGFTNFFRNYGGLTSLLVMFIDAVKAVIACMLGRWLLVLKLNWKSVPLSQLHVILIPKKRWLLVWMN